jgi:hypothetical protein
MAIRKQAVQEFYYGGPKALTDYLNKLSKEYGTVKIEVLSTIGNYVMAGIIKLIDVEVPEPEKAPKEVK